MSRLRIWVDCTAAAHPVVLRPVIEQLAERGHDVRVTARAYGQTEELLERIAIPYESFGAHGGAGRLGKAWALLGRSAALLRWARPHRFELAIAHGSVDVAVVGTLLRVPQVQMQDYEHAGLQRKLAWRAAARVIVPDAIPVPSLERAGAKRSKLLRYPGLKEDYYLADFEPDPSVLAELGLRELGVEPERGADEKILVVVRPPPETSEYHAENPLYERLLDRLAADPRVIAVLIPRTAGQAASARARGERSLVVPERAVDAQSLIAYADQVVSAGGTMNREAVALGIPVATIFSGAMGAVDEALIASGRLTELTDVGALELGKRRASPGPRQPRDVGPLVDAMLAVGRERRP